MFEIHKMLCEIAKSLLEDGGLVCGLIGSGIYIFDMWYLWQLLNIPFYLRDIAENTRRGR